MTTATMTSANRTSTYALVGLHCNACVGRITKALAPLASNVSVSLSPMQVTLTDTAADIGTLQTAVESAGKYILLPDSVSNLELNQASDTAIAQSIQARAAPENIAKEDTKVSWLATYSPLLLIITYILGGSVLVQIGLGGLGSVGSVTTQETMRYFMAGFFLVFSFFKLLDVRAFADAYTGYDLLAKRWRGWALLYPFVELALGLAYLANFNPVATYWVTVGVMGFSAIGVVQAVLAERSIQCACLGTVFKLPMTTVTIVEDLGMVGMAVWMLLMAT